VAQNSGLRTQDSGLPFAWLDSLLASGIRPGLGRMRALLRALGRPQAAVPAVIVAGTNGKGSTSAMLASILRASGYRTGFYTSPHLVDLRERWAIDGTMIDEASLDAAIGELQRAAERCGITPTYFEALTLIAFIAFAAAECEVSVLEVGMGGRLDATNVVRPLASVITPIGLDHTEFLGNTLRKIAREKAGIIHRGAVVVTSNDDPAVVGVLQRRAAQFGNRFVVERGEHDTPLAGPFQRRNAALAVRAAEELRGILPRISAESIARGVRETRWRGRLERIDVAGKAVWVDGCHNAHAAGPIAAFIARELPRPRTLVFGVMSDKDVGALTSALFPLFDLIIATEPYPPRNESAPSLVARAAALGVEAVAEPEPSRAIERALEASARVVFVGGSLYLAGAAIEQLDARQQHEQQ
jgi:dihydrofolate synthase/folylpolyglutamate synthase